jgi:hypothetical protein
MTAVRYCKSPTCPNPTVPLDPERVRHGAETCNDKCRAAAWKAEHRYGRHDQVAGRANASTGTRKRSGLQVSYRRASALLAEWLHDNYPRDDVDEMDRWDALAEAILRPAMSERQLKQLDSRNEGSST